MKRSPQTVYSILFLTDYSDLAAWNRIRSAIERPIDTPAGTFQAYIEFFIDPEYEGITSAQLVAMVPKEWDRSFAFIADGTTLAHPEHPILVVDLFTEPGRTFRVIPSEMWAVQNNLFIANMDFAEFADATDPDGIFRGFPMP